MTHIRKAAAAAALTALALVAGCANTPLDPNVAAMRASLSGMSEVPQVATQGMGEAEVWLNKQTNVLKWKVTYSGLSGPATMGHFHGPAVAGVNAGVVVPFQNPVTSPIEGQTTITAAQAKELTSGLWYINIHTAANRGGEIRGQVLPR
ncbi:CHRD domain-containing protein [Pigmentiphaga aceris]|uniref:CHRD domain-containing protein n=1 Tax=Pigmentiphaga aceris TaxID=1940612 RepID=A0A5C0B2F4_9BURK|nr:CHRD domain-containing protein [Pigmentiphaga aceris]QEI08938.1 CHRD domain-containing protein [Pigmentiphaga aceris]